MPQTSVSLKPAVSIAGMLADASMVKDADTYTNEEASAELAFGRMVKQGTADDQAKVFAAQSDKAVGVVLHSHAFAKDDQLGTTGLKPKVSFGALQKGKVWVEVDEAVSPADAVRFRATSSGGTPGVFRKTSSAGNTILVNSGRWLSTTSGAGLALLDLDMTGRAGWTLD